MSLNQSMKTSKLKKRLLWSLGIFVALLVILCTHIYVSTNDYNEGGTVNWQLSRIDFKQPIDSTEAQKIENYTKNIKGITQAVFNQEHGTLVYAYFPGTQTSENVFKLVQSSGNYKAERYIVSEEMASGGCPVMGGGEMMQRLVLYVGRMKERFQ